MKIRAGGGALGQQGGALGQQGAPPPIPLLWETLINGVCFSRIIVQREATLLRKRELAASL